ncbi:MAG: kdsD [Deltaproteobacteria bacterium]|jgi:arabinose-5-phosphate isomerase|nr:kdsD [Deltaproteobacteria bacterium]
MSRYVDIGKEVLRKEADAILSIMACLNEDFENTVNTIAQCKGRVVMTGIGKSGLICKKIASTLSSIGVSAIFLHPADSIHGDLGILQNGDVVIVVSNSGETEELIKVLPWIRRMDVTMVVITGVLESTIAKYGDIVLGVKVDEACPHNLVPTSSTTATLALGDALAIALMDKRNFSIEDFASLHPGGTLGRKLLLTVEELMHTGEQLPRVFQDTSTKDVIFEITSKRLGVTAVLNRDSELVGVVTDGDLRRAIERYDNVMSRSASDVMTKNPKVIKKDALATYALKKMEEFSITSLFVVEKEGEKRPMGIIHIHDLLKAKIA